MDRPIARTAGPSAPWGVPAAIGAGALSVLMGVLVLVGWHWRLPSLVQIFPSFVPMQYNTALGFLTGGLGLLALVFGRLRLAAGCALLVALLGALTLIQYPFGVDLGIDRLLMEPYITVKTSHPGRMAPNTALGFVLFGATLATASWSRRLDRLHLDRFHYAATALGLCVLSLGFACLLAYLGGVETVYGWGAFTRMAVHTAVGFSLLGAGILAWCYWRAAPTGGAYSPWIPRLTALAGTMVTVLVWGGLATQERTRVEVAVGIESEYVTEELATAVNRMAAALKRMALRWEARGGTPLNEWSSDARAYLANNPEYEAIERIDPSWKVRWTVLQEGGERPSEEGLRLLKERSRAALEQRETGTLFTKAWALSDGSRAISIFASISAKRGFDGGILATVAVEKLLDSLLENELARGLRVTIENERGLVYGRAVPLPEDKAAWARVSSFDLHGLRWRVRVWPGPDLLEGLISRLPRMALGVGLMTSFLLGFIVRLAQLARLRAFETETANEEMKTEIGERMRAEEKLHSLTATLEEKVAERTQALAEQRSAALNMMADAQAARKVAEHAEERFRSLLEAAPDAFVITRETGEIVLVNRQAEKLFGYSRQELLGSNVDMLVPVQSRAAHPTKRAEYLQKPDVREMGAKRDLFARRKDGSEVPVEISLGPLSTDEGVLVSAAVRDVTDRKAAEKEIQNKNQELETLLYVTSHDLREPLRAIESFSLLVKERYAKALDEKGADFLDRVVKAAVRMRGLLDDILALSRIRRIDEPKDEIDTADIVEAALESLEETIRRTDASVLVSPGLPKLRINSTWTTQAVYNLIANALKFTQEGRAPEIEIAPYRAAPGEPGGAGIVVRDRGPGVPPEFTERIFHLFQRAVGREVEGTGAGLAIVRGIAERYGGKAWVQPRQGGGAEFIITFDQINEGGGT